MEEQNNTSNGTDAINKKKVCIVIAICFLLFIAVSIQKTYWLDFLTTVDINKAVIFSLTYRIIEVILISSIIIKLFFVKPKFSIIGSLITIMITYLVVNIMPFTNMDNYLNQIDTYKSPLVYSINLIKDLRENEIVVSNTNDFEVKIDTYTTTQRLKNNQTMRSSHDYCYASFDGIKIGISGETYNTLINCSRYLDEDSCRAVYEEYKYDLYSDLRTIEQLKNDKLTEEDDNKYFQIFKHQFCSLDFISDFDCTIEYYKNSKRIKSINGYDFSIQLSEINQSIVDSRIENLRNRIQNSLLESNENTY